MIQAGTCKYKENWEILLVDNNGKVLEKEVVSNTIVNSGLERLAKLQNGISSTYFRALAIGTGSTAVTNSDTALDNEYSRALATLSYESDYKTKYTHTWTFGTGVDENITEAGIFDSTTETGSVMLARVTFTAKHVTAGKQLIVTALITASRV